MPGGIDPTMFPHTGPVRPETGRASRGNETVASRAAFDQLLRKEMDELKFSAHAQQRMVSRGIHLTEQDRARLREAVARADAKGARDSLILMRDMAFVVSVKNRTVITAMDEQSMRQNVFTNIDSAVIV